MVFKQNFRYDTSS